MAFVRLDHVQLAVPAGGEAEAERFWCGLLGFERVAKPASLAARGGAWFVCGEVAVHVGAVDPATFVPATKAHPAFVVDGLDALAGVLAAAGHEPRWSDEVPGTRRFHVDDPFGNRLELIAAG